MSAYGLSIFPQHAAMLAASGITPEHAAARGYRSVDTKTRLEAIGVTKTGRNVPGLLIPSLRADGSTWGHQYRPDAPRLRDDKPVKYETPTGQSNGLDVPPGVGPKLADPSVPLIVTEGVKKADAAACRGLACIALPGVWSWRGRNEHGGKTAVPDWHDVALNGRRVVLAFDSDVVVKPAVRRALSELAAYLSSKGAKVEYLHLPHTGDGKTGLDDWLADGHDVADLWALVRPQMPEPLHGIAPEPVAPPAPSPAPVPTASAATRPRDHSWADVEAAFRTWFGPKFDLQYLAAVLAVTASGIHLDGDPCWLLVVGGAGVGKTEALAATERAGCHVVSTISGEAALLSGTPAVERSKEATGGLLRVIGDRGTLIIKDFTSILSMRREDRAGILAALREVYDGKWVRLLGSEGGRTLTWAGRATVVGGVTSVYDEHHGVIASMGDRFLLLRVDSEDDDVRRHASRMAMRNSGGETAMRTELGEAVAGFLLSRPVVEYDLPDDLLDELIDVADVITRARSQVAADFKGDPEWAHAPEMPTRVAKQLVQLWRGARVLGMGDDQARAIVRRVAHDTIPPARRLALLDVHDHPGSTSGDVARRIGMARKTVDRKLQELALHRLVRHESSGMAGDSVWRWYPVADRLPVIDLLRSGYGITSEGWAETSTHGGKGEEEGATPSQMETVAPQIQGGERFRPPLGIDPVLVELAAALPPPPDELPLPADDPWQETA